MRVSYDEQGNQVFYTDCGNYVGYLMELCEYEKYGESKYVFGIHLDNGIPKNDRINFNGHPFISRGTKGNYCYFRSVFNDDVMENIQ